MRLDENEQSRFGVEVYLPLDGIPSGGKAYPKGTKIFYRPYNFGEIRYISDSKVPVSELLKVVLRGVRVEGMEVEELTQGDVHYIALLKKISSVGTSKIKVEYRCPHCKKLEQVIIGNSDIEFDEIGASELPIIAPLSIGEVEFYPLTFNQYLELVREGKDRDEMSVMSAMSRMNMPLEEKTKRLSELTSPSDIILLEEVDRLLYHMSKPLQLVCGSCKGKVEIPLEEGESILLPFHEEGESKRPELRFGKKRSSLS